MIRLPIEGEEFGRYRLLRKLGQGGMGVVFAAHDTSLDREVAVKLVIPHLAGDEGFRARFQHEAATLARLESPRIVRIYDHGEHDDVLFLVTQLVAGGDLQTLMQREGALPPALATSVLAQVLEGLGDAHAVSVVHRDIKPANVLLRERGRELEAFLCDFGIATTPGADLSRTGAVAGSLPYMAPERHQGEDAGPQGDIYAAGCLFWHALTGSAPYAGTDVEIAVAHMQAPIPQLPGKDDFSQAANAVIRKAMAKDRRKRYPTTRAMLTELGRLTALAPDAISLPGATAIRQPVVIGTRPRRWVPAAAAVAAVLAVIGTAVVAGGAIGSRDRTVADPTTLRPDTPSSSTPAATGSPALVVDRPVLRPVGSGRVPTWNPGVVVGDDPLLADTGPEAPGRAADVPSQPAPAPVRRPRTVVSVRPGPTATATATRTAAPSYNWRCWNGAQVMQYSDCTHPRGRAGADWVFPDFSRLGCTETNLSGTRDREAYRCVLRRGVITFARWDTHSAAVAYGRSWINNRRNQGTWSLNGVETGTQVHGRWDFPNRAVFHYRLFRVYRAGSPWSVMFNGEDSIEDRRALQQASDAYRALNRLRGVPL